MSQQADQRIEHLLIKRFGRLISVRRFVLLWVVLFSAIILAGVAQYRDLSSYYQTLKPVPGGIYHEGIVGNFTNANPLFAAGRANTAVSRLVFSGLFKYDNSNNLTGDLAENWKLNNAEDIYTVSLKKGITWHDGQPFSADDVVFTYAAIHNPETRSTLYNSWRDIKVTKKDNFTVEFDLPNALSSFPHSLTNGIIPAHLLKDIQPFQLRSASFNTTPVGTGPFVWKFIEIADRGTEKQQQRISLAAFDNYWAGKPRLDGFSLTTFSSEDQLLEAFRDEQISAMSGPEQLPEDMVDVGSIETHVTPLTSIVMAFLNNSRAPLDNVDVRKAMVAGVNKEQLSNFFDQPTRLADSPLLPGQPGYSRKSVQAEYNVQRGNDLLDKAGWTKNAAGHRAKGGQELSFTLSAQDTHQYTTVAKFLQRQWEDLGIKVIVRYHDADYIQSAVIANHDYDILLHGIEVGVDPDVFAYWDSSQASVTSQGHLNLSEYKSKAADAALAAARTRADTATRATKYQAFLNAWVADAPALALYSPNYLYVTHGPVFGFTRKQSNGSADRFYNVHEWMIRQQKQSIQ